MDTHTNGQEGNFSYIGFHYYSLTWCCHERQPIFTERDRVEFVRAQFFRASIESEVADVAYCFMRDHVHQLVKGESPTADCRLYIAKAKQYSGFYFKKAYGEKLWLRKGFNRVLLGDHEVRTAIAYIIENPVRARLVDKLEDYPFTGSSKYTIRELMEMAYAI